MKKLLIITGLLLLGSLAFGQLLDMFLQTAPENYTRQDEFAKYVRGGYLMSVSYYQYFSPNKDIDHLEAAALTAFRFSYSNVGVQQREEPAYVITLGILDNLGSLQGSVKGKTVSSMYADIAGLYGGYIMPLMDYGAYMYAGAKAAAFFQPPMSETYQTLNTDFTYAHDFVINGTERSIVKARPIELSSEATVRFGLKVYKNWFASLALGARLTSNSEGKWYLTHDVNRWLGGDDTFLPEYEYWTDASLPSQNYLLSGTTYFLTLGISPFF